MKRFFHFYLFSLLVFNSVTSQELGIEGKEYASSKGEPIYMPLGKISFADKIVSFTIGKPHAQEEFSNPLEALGEPNYTHYKVPRYVSLGCGGQLTLEFTDNGFMDMEGPDLYVWEVGPSEEDFLFEISKDGKEWRSLGRIDGGKSYIDIAPAIQEENEIFYFVRLTDLEHICNGDTPGADIDAVGTISGVIKIELNADVLFDSARFNLKPEANIILENLANKILQVGIAEILIEGHTDSDGSAAYNQELSQQRANSVLNKLKEILIKGEYLYKTKPYGKTKPIATNKTEEGKQMNRRVEIIVLPHKDFYKKKSGK
ncbi:MAG: OmpA family protein [Flavobacteriales bacterium]|jgi:outer membrane protein OmpA-like peptidoglycan-associated protein|nr:OmpA family protein [Flavobacteriales bacterium]